MTQPKFAPISRRDEVRPAYRLDPPAPWRPTRPAELAPRPGTVHGGGVPGPDQGYALRLAASMAGRLVLGEGEHEADVLAGAVAIGLRRASLFGRAPVAADVELPLRLFGYLDEEAPAALLAERRARFGGIAHDYRRARLLVDSVPESTLRSTPSAVAGAAGGSARVG